MVFQFLKQYRAHLVSFEKGSKKNLRRLIDSIDEYADALSPPLELLPHGALLAGGLKLGIKGAQKLFGTPKEANAIFDHVSEVALSLKRRTVVLVDDIDRLTAAETRQIFQLVKLTARFPYIVYVLAFDRVAVADALGDVGVKSGEEYLEKIVQVSFDLPSISDATLTGFITSGLDELIAKHRPAHFDMHRFGNLFHGGFRGNFASIRDVRRFFNGLELGFQLIGSELNGVDFVGIEALRTFYPRTFDVVRQNKEVFSGHIDLYAQQAGPDKFRKTVDDLLAPTQEVNERLKDLLLELFPKLSFAYGHATYGHEFETSWEKTYRVATERYFDAYFHLVLPTGEVAIAQITELIERSGDSVEVLRLLSDLKSVGKIKNALASLRYRLGEVPQSSLNALLAALFEIGDLVGDGGSILAKQIPEYWHVRWAIFDVLNRLDPTVRVKAVLDVAANHFAPKSLVDVLNFVGELREKKKEYEEFDDKATKDIRALIVLSISKGSQDAPSFVRRDALPTLLHFWAEWGDPKEPQAFVAKVLKSDHDVVALGNSFIYQIHSHGGGDRVARSHNRLAMKSMSRWVEPKEFLLHLNALDPSKLTEAEREISAVLRTELSSFINKGITVEQYENDRFFGE